VTKKADWRVRPNGRGGFDLRLPTEERSLLAGLPSHLEHALSQMDDGPTGVSEPLRRLFPPAYPTDAGAEDAYVSKAREDLIAHHRESLGVLARTAGAKRLSDAELQSWLNALNDLRLVFGSSLGISEETAEFDESDPRYSDWVCYLYLSFLEGEVVDALSESLPPARSEDDPELPDDPWGEPPGGLRWDGTPIPEQP